MQPTTCFQHGIPNAILQEADGVFHDPVAFHPTHGMFDPDTDGRDATLGRFLWRREFPPTRCFLGLEHRDPRQDNSLEALILLQTTARGKRIASLLRQTLIRRVAFRGSAQKENVTGLIAHQHILQRVPFLLATVIFLLVFWILGALDGAFGPLVQKKGAVGAPSASCRANSPANSSAVRAGRRCWLANA